MIVSFADRETEALHRRERVRRIDPRVQQAALRKLRYLDNAASLDDLRVPPGNRLEALGGDLAGRHSIRINDHWRIVFTWRNGNAHDVAIVDYHRGRPDMPARKLRPVHPGEVLRLDFLEPMGISVYRLAQETGITAQHLGRIIRGTRGVSAEVALRLARFFGTSARVWMGLQAQFDLDVAQDVAGRKIRERVRPYKAA